jgi:hypothetical protein
MDWMQYGIRYRAWNLQPWYLIRFRSFAKAGQQAAASALPAPLAENVWSFLDKRFRNTAYDASHPDFRHQTWNRPRAGSAPLWWGTLLLKQCCIGRQGVVACGRVKN